MRMCNEMRVCVRYLIHGRHSCQHDEKLHPQCPNVGELGMDACKKRERFDGYQCMRRGMFSLG